MIQFLTLVLSLHVGILPVEVAVTDAVAGVELRLDGQSVGKRTEPPWKFNVDLGRDLVPHRLEAIALDAEGREIERISQWINYARRHWEASLVLEPSTDRQPRSGRVVWATSDHSAPLDIQATLNGQPVTVDGKGNFQLPTVDPSQVQHLEAQVLFSGDHVAKAEAVFGGVHGEQLTSALTAVPLRLPSDAAQPTVEQLGQWLQVRGQPARVFSTRSEGRSIVIVRDTHIDSDLRQVLREKRQKLFAKGGRFLRPEDQVEFILTFTLGQDPQGVHRPAPIPQDFNKLGLWNLFTQDYPQINRPNPQRLWWSLALAGKRVADLKQPRVVVFLLSKKPKSRPGLSFEQAQTYLRSLHVPLLVWAPEEATFESLGMQPDRPYLGAEGMLQLFSDVDRLLDEQTMVWVEGDYLSTEVTLSDAAPSTVRLAH